MSRDALFLQYFYRKNFNQLFADIHETDEFSKDSGRTHLWLNLSCPILRRSNKVLKQNILTEW